VIDARITFIDCALMRTQRVVDLVMSKEQVKDSAGEDGGRMYNEFLSRKVKLGDVRIVDTTCRDGEQMPGISFTCDEKLEIAQWLEKLGAEQIETFATYNESDKRCAKKLTHQAKKISIMGWNRLVKSDVEDSIAHGVDAVSVSTDTSDIALKNKLKMTRADQLDKLADCVRFAKDHGVYVCFNAGDATRTDPDYLVEFAKVGKDAGGDRFRICDTIGILTPSASARLIHKVMSSVDIEVEFHAHNDFGLAVANALAACEAAAEFEDRALWVSTTVNGLGERAGNVPIEVFVMNLHAHYGVKKYNAENIMPLCKHVSKASGMQIPLNYPIVGGNMFTHKSGIHVDGILKNPQLYEAFDPAVLGVARKIALGKHSGKASIKHKLKQFGLMAPPEMIDVLRQEVSRLGETTKRDLTDDEFLTIYDRIIGDAASQHCRTTKTEAELGYQMDY
jgi:homocitrate synthase NifV